MSDSIIIVTYDANWSNLFLHLGKSIRDVLGDIAIRIDHIGSTSIVNMPAKPIIDVQVSVKDFSQVNWIEQQMNTIGFRYMKNNEDKSQCYFREMAGNKRTHIHIRKTGGWDEVFNLLFRDYLRCHPQDCLLYERKKYELSQIYKDERWNYTEGKSKVIWEIMQKAHRWSQQVAWYPGESDA
jgi:GrpB-like predicted nucleotidyltransferase (UPF0157 family)